VVLIAAAGLAMAGSSFVLVHPDRTGSYVDAAVPDAGLPTGSLTTRSQEHQAHDRGPTGARRTPRTTSGADLGRLARPSLPVVAAPETSSRRALERAGRLSAPTTAPPVLS